MRYFASRIHRFADRLISNRWHDAVYLQACTLAKVFR